MPHGEKTEIIAGRLQQLLFSPKGGIEGVLISVDSETIQVSMKHDAADARALQKAIGKPIELTAAADRSEKAKKSKHPVYSLQALTKLGQKNIAAQGAPHAINGVVAAIHFAKHGEPNGVVLESGEFIHTRPPGMKKLNLKVGSKVSARGEVRMTILGTALVEADEVNRVVIE